LAGQQLADVTGPAPQLHIRREPETFDHAEDRARINFPLPEVQFA
jgi:hypothetical protein